MGVCIWGWFGAFVISPGPLPCGNMPLYPVDIYRIDALYFRYCHVDLDRQETQTETLVLLCYRLDIPTKPTARFYLPSLRQDEITPARPSSAEGGSIRREITEYFGICRFIAQPTGHKLGHAVP
jgi:hypothetical protein